MKGSLSKLDVLAALSCGLSLDGIRLFNEIEKMVANDTQNVRVKRIRSGKSFPAVGAKQAERYQKQGLRNVDVNGFSLIQRG